MRDLPAAAAFALGRSAGLFVRMSSLFMSMNFGEGASASFHARTQAILKFELGLTHTFTLHGCLTGCLLLFWVCFDGGGLRRFMIGSPLGRRPSPGPHGGKYSLLELFTGPEHRQSYSAGDDGDVTRITAV
ncbi:MAG TPA: hypothetical protein VFP11_01555 [Candidatus Angelobacter sp.]|nr:hypothetical protein [Candidatus Angelobacter sp.]